jgi:hypothetical protein
MDAALRFSPSMHRIAAGKAVPENKACQAFVPAITTGWETLAKAAEPDNIGTR